MFQKYINMLLNELSLIDLQISSSALLLIDENELYWSTAFRER